MKNLIFLIIPLIFLSSCSIDWNDEKWKNDTFYKKLECSKIVKWDIEKQLIESHNSWLQIKEIFFSPQKNSCLYSASSSGWPLYLFDYNQKLNLSLDMPIDPIQFDMKIKELKWE